MLNKIAAINLGKLEGLGPLGLEGKTAEQAPTLFNLFISGVIGLMTTIAFIWFTFNFVIGAIGIITAGGDKGKIESARARITTGIIGIVVVISSLFIIQLLGSLTGVGNIILRPTDIINLISPK